jgi:hypothetical protein
LSYAEEVYYRGYSKYDALNSPFLDWISFGNKYLRLIYTQAIMRFPFNIRQLLFVPKQENPKGIGLFAHTYCNLYDIYGDPVFVERIKYCLDFLLKNQSKGDYSGPCWGYNFAWQTPGFFVPRNAPNMVVSAIVGQAFLRAFDVLGEQHYLDTARGIIDFIRNDLNVLKDSNGLLCYSYTPFDNWRVINISAFAAGLMSRIYEYTGENHLIEEAAKLIRFVVDKQTDYGAWYYTDPSNKSNLTHDNYHTGYILDAIYQYMTASGDIKFKSNHERGLTFYKKNLFLPDGTPKFLHNRTYPIDIHGAAQGIITFSRAAPMSSEYMDRAIQIAGWTECNMLGKDGHFYYQKTRFYTKRFSLLRWAQGWMCFALSVLLLSLSNKRVP